MSWEHYPIGDGCLCWQLADTISLEVSTKVIHLYRTVKSAPDSVVLGILDVVPSYNAVAVHFDPATADPTAIQRHVTSLMEALPQRISEIQGRQHILTVDYSGPDLPLVAGHCGMGESEVVRIHAAGIYHRDIKPSNILLTRRQDGVLQAKLTDFGLGAANPQRANAPHDKNRNENTTHQRKQSHQPAREKPRCPPGQQHAERTRNRNERHKKGNKKSNNNFVFVC